MSLCEECGDTGLQGEGVLLAGDTVPSVCFQLCHCDAGVDRAREGRLDSVLAHALALVFLPCPGCGRGGGIREDGEFCQECLKGQERARTAKQMLRTPRATETKPRRRSG